MAVMSYIDAITLAMREEMERDEKVFVLGEDVGKKGGVFKATHGLYDQFGEDRALDAPLAESAIAGVAIGAAMYGMRPIAEMQFADFIMPAVNQIVSEAAKIRYRSNNDWTCPVTIRAPFGGGVHGALYHSQSVEAMFANQPGLKIVIPSTPYDAKGLLKAAIRDEDPVLFFEHKRAYRLIKGEVPEDDYVLPIGKADVKRGEGPTLIETVSYRLTAHSSDDDDRVYRDKEEVEEAKKKDSIITFAAYLKEAGVLTEESEKQMLDEIMHIVNEATEYAENAPYAAPEDALKHVYAE